MKVEYATFPERESRSKYISEYYANVLKTSILDVGCDNQHIRKFLPEDISYTGIDISGTPTVKINLEKVDKLPFDDNAFDTVICTDVLEHLDNLHHIFAELVRVSKKHLIISLPNNWNNARKPIKIGKGSFAHYGLPAERPIDRHKWFFNITEAQDFLTAQCISHNLKEEEQHVTDKPRPFFTRALRRLKECSQERYINRYANTLWTLLSKKDD
jgi:2-polyprenyl-3-methyl-5-hydroxy-6-metoxy-1,4-benzoquinol methylase